MVRVRVTFDGASVWVGNRYIGGWGFTVGGMDLDHEACGSVEIHDTRATNNVAEYTAAIQALEYVASRRYRGPVEVAGDSQLVIRQMKGEYRVRATHLKPLHNRLSHLALMFEKVDYVWMPREQNRRADELSKRGLKSG